MNSFEACILYRGLKLHFNSSYDFVKYNGKIKYSKEQFEKNKHKFVYEKLSKKYQDKELKTYFLSNFLQNENIWVQDLLTSESQDIYTKFNKIQQSLSYVFKSDVENLFFENDIKELFRDKSNDYPIVLKKFFKNEICFDTLVILDNFFKCFSKWEITEDIIYPKLKFKISKYKYFLEYDSGKFKKILLDTIESAKNI